MKCLPTHTAIALAVLFTLPAFAAPEATVLFAQPGTQIISPTGVARPVKKGDVVQTGERLVTPPGGISQIKLLDGSLVGLRPDSELKIALPPAAADKGVQVVSLTKGAVHVIGAELMDSNKPSRFTLQSGLATLQLKGADLESSIVPSSGPKPQGSGDAGSYNLMRVGSGSIESGKSIIPLEPMQTSFVGSTSDTPPISVSILGSSSNDFGIPPKPEPSPDPNPRPKFIPKPPDRVPPRFNFYKPTTTCTTVTRTKVTTCVTR